MDTGQERTVGPLSIDDLPMTETRPGIHRRVFTAGDLQLIIYRYDAGSVFEPHQHPEQQLTVCIKGSLEFTIGGKEVHFNNGDMAHIPGGVVHSAVNNGMEDAVTFNIFTPPKKGL